MRTAMVDTAHARLWQTRRRRLVPASVTLLAAAATLGAAAPARAGLQQEMAIFNDCPVNAPNVITCVYSPVTSGEFKLGGKTVAIDKTVLLQGGISSTSADLVPAADGNTLSKTTLTVPGGLVGIEGLGGEVTATAELAGAVELNGANLLERKGTAVSLPLKVKLGNPLLGEACYIGSTFQPVNPLLTTGTTSPPGPNKPISGSLGALSFSAGQRITSVPAELVDNAFSVPGANGCGGLLQLLIDPLVDLASGVPAAAGHNTAVMNGVLETAPVAAVKAQAALPEIGRCVPAQSTGEGREKVYHGAFEDKGCTTEAQHDEGKYEWITGAAKAKFTAKGAAMTLAGASGAGVTCKSSTIAGEYTGSKTVAASVTFKGCRSTASKEACQSDGAPAGEILASGLTGGLGFIEDQQTESSLLVSVGVDLGDGLPRSVQCDGVEEALEVDGSVIAPIAKIDAMSKTFTLTYTASAGRQSPEQFEGEAKDTLTATLGAGAEQAGLTTTEKISNEEPIEVKAVANG
jgi:hypothetical protein